MLYVKKNLPTWERTLRVTSGLAMVVGGLVGLHATLLGIGVAALGAVPIVTGIIGYCPACGIVGRGPVESAGEARSR